MVEESKTCHNGNRKSHGAHVNLRPRYGAFVTSKLILVKKSNRERDRDKNISLGLKIDRKEKSCVKISTILFGMPE
jgi:hypothetical protein